MIFGFTRPRTPRFVMEESYRVLCAPTACPIVTVAPSLVSMGVAGVFYQLTFSASGGSSPYKFSVVSGAVPPGLVLEEGVLSGTPTLTGSYVFTVQVSDGNGCLGTREYTLRISTFWGNGDCAETDNDDWGSTADNVNCPGEDWGSPGDDVIETAEDYGSV